MMCKNLFTAIFIASAILLSTGCSKPRRADFNVIPAPIEVVELQDGDFELNAHTVICYPIGDETMQRNAEFLAQYIEQLTELRLLCSDEVCGDNAITLSRNLVSDNIEAYRLSVASDAIVIQGASPAGVFYGVQTLRKALPATSRGSIVIPAVEVNDAPRFAYRGAHLDVARHFVAPDSVKRYIDILALHNINRFHWHLTDDQGWRIAIEKYPRLTEVGSYRPETVVGHNTSEYDGIPHAGFYTQDEIRDIVAYAAQRYITVIPEIDLPGHMQAALAAYPHLGCTGGPYEVWQRWGVSDNVLCVGSDVTLQFVKDVLTEVVALFPSEYIHVGGDECLKVRWKECPRCQARIAQERLYACGEHTAEERLQSYVIKIAEQHLNSLGRKMIGWDETLEGGLAPGATVMSWRGERGGIEAARKHHDVIMTPNTYLYFDYYQAEDKSREPLAIGGYLPLSKVYSYEPVPSNLSSDEARHIIGVQANLWTEYISHFSHIEYMVLPRVAALCEVQWSKPEKKCYESFTSRLPRMMQVYEALGYNYATHVFDIQAQCAVHTDTRSITLHLATIDSAEIRYTFDGSEPAAVDMLYSDSIIIDRSCTLRAAAVRSGVQGRELNENFTFNKATACPIMMLSPINKQYHFRGATTLVDGLRGKDTNIHTGRWIAFYRNDMEAVIDLGSAMEISKVGFNTCVEKGSWIFDTRGVTISTSLDGENYTVAHEVLLPPMTEAMRNGIYSHNYNLSPVTARYLRLKLLAEHSIPTWHNGRGLPGFLFVDEIIVQ